MNEEKTEKANELPEQPEPAEGDPNSLGVNDLNLMVNILDAVAQRGGVRRSHRRRLEPGRRNRRHPEWRPSGRGLRGPWACIGVFHGEARTQHRDIGRRGRSGLFHLCAVGLG